MTVTASLGRPSNTTVWLERLRQFTIAGDSSPKVRTWLADAEREDDRVRREGEQVEATVQRRPLQVHPGRVRQYLEDLQRTLERGGLRARQLLQGDIKQITIHRVAEAARPFARAEVVSAGEGLLGRVAFVVAGGRFGRWADDRPLEFRIQISYSVPSHGLRSP